MTPPPVWQRLIRGGLLAIMVAAVTTVFVTESDPGPLFWAATAAFLVAYVGYLFTNGDAPHPLPDEDGHGGWSIPPRVHLVVLAVAVPLAGVGIINADSMGSTILYGLALVVGVMHVPTVLVALARERAARQADEDADEDEADEIPDDVPADAAVPRGGVAGFWDGLEAYGPGYTHGPVYVRTGLVAWTLPWTDEPVRCPDCGQTVGLALVYLEGYPRTARFRCTSCGTTWRDPVWSTADAVDHVETTSVSTVPVGQDTRDADPDMAYLAEMMRREAGNTPRRDPRDGADDEGALW